MKAITVDEEGVATRWCEYGAPATRRSGECAGCWVARIKRIGDSARVAARQIKQAAKSLARLGRAIK